MHGAAAGLVALGVLGTPQLALPLTAQRYTVRSLDLRAPEVRRAYSDSVAYPGPSARTRRASRPSPPGAKPPASALHLPQTAQAKLGPQTLIQPDVRDPVVLAHVTPLPSVVIWAPEKTPVRNIVPPQPHKLTATDVTPSIAPANEEVNLSDLRVSASQQAVQNLALLPATSSPVVIHAPDLAQVPPTSASDTIAQPTPATVVSLSDLRMQNGTVALPPANQTKSATAPGALSPGQADGANNPAAAEASTPGGSGAQTGGKGAGHSAVKLDASAGQSGGQSTGQSSGQSSGVHAGQSPGSSNASSPGVGAGSPASASVINLPHGGQFSSVVVGNAISDEYPEITDLWTGRMAYTVYLHLGLARSWILQYSLPASADAAAAGEVAALDAPWPYNIVRPNIPAGSVDAIMVHGFVNQAGRFEALSIAFPSGFAQAPFVLGSLAQWQFRPAAQNGQPVRVEVLLIIPEDQE